MVRHTGQPAYLQIADDLRAQIRGGSLPPGAPLPSTAKLAEQYGASLSVVKLAVGVLRTEGLVIGQQGKGVFVRDAESAPRDELAELRATVEDLSRRLAKVEEQLATSTTRRSGRSSR
ncbi:winged helix-turn-helix domain-containing protein [Nonomuraea sp. N2-4H]|uniref:GntR family transcriptional regulator n=1 Tax=unclassified Nonomuraea TaxID=2593643 RepID=UPI00324C4D17